MLFWHDTLAPLALRLLAFLRQNQGWIKIALQLNFQVTKCIRLNSMAKFHQLQNGGAINSPVLPELAHSRHLSLSYGSYLHDHRSKVVKLGSGWFCRQKFSHYLPCKKRHLFEGPRNSQVLNLWFVGLGLVRWVHLKWSRVNTVINYNGVHFFVNWTELGSLIMKC